MDLKGKTTSMTWCNSSLSCVIFFENLKMRTGSFELRASTADASATKVSVPMWKDSKSHAPIVASSCATTSLS